MSRGYGERKKSIKSNWNELECYSKVAYYLDTLNQEISEQKTEIGQLKSEISQLEIELNQIETQIDVFKKEEDAIMKKQHLKFFIRYAIFLFFCNYGSQTLVEEGLLTKNLTYILMLFPICLVGSLLIVKKSYFNQNDTDQGKER